MIVKHVHQDNIEQEEALPQMEIEMLVIIEEHLQHQRHHQEVLQILESVQQDIIAQREQEILFNDHQERLIRILKVHHLLLVKLAQQDLIAHNQIYQLLKANVLSDIIAQLEQMLNTQQLSELLDINDQQEAQQQHSVLQEHIKMHQDKVYFHFNIFRYLKSMSSRLYVCSWCYSFCSFSMFSRKILSSGIINRIKLYCRNL